MKRTTVFVLFLLAGGLLFAQKPRPDAFPPAPDTLARVDVLSIEGTATAIRVTLENWHGLSFTDFHNLIKEDGQWKIVAKVFHQYN